VNAPNNPRREPFDLSSDEIAAAALVRWARETARLNVTPKFDVALEDGRFFVHLAVHGLPNALAPHGAGTGATLEEATRNAMTDLEADVSRYDGEVSS
jgi:hypothetical protein